MSSRTAICNKALRKISASPIFSLEDDDSQSAIECRSLYGEILEEVLKSYNWRFARFRKTLLRDDTYTASFGYRNRFILPTIPKYLKLVAVSTNDEEPRDQEGYIDKVYYKIENDALFTDEGTVNIIYIGRQEDINKYSPLFIDAFACKMAMELAYKLTGNPRELRAELKEEYMSSLLEASDSDQQEDQEDPLIISNFNDIRFNGASYSYFKN